MPNVTNAPPSEMGEAFSLQYLSAELRCKCFSGGEVRKAPSNEIVLIVAATRTALVFDPVLMVKLVHVVYPPHVTWAVQGDPNLGVASNANAGIGGVFEGSYKLSALGHSRTLLHDCAVNNDNASG
jgi:hypothetical protein